VRRGRKGTGGNVRAGREGKGREGGKRRGGVPALLTVLVGSCLMEY